ncbi:ABC transporter substrate-binding protein [Desulforhopalus sp. 52FAK]
MKIKACSCATLLLATFILLFSGCDSDQRNVTPGADNKSGTASSSSDAVDVIRLAGGDWGYPSPFAHYPRGPGGFKMALIFDSLLERDEKGLIPWLAEDYTVESDGLTYRFTIREGVFWQDGTPLTVEDVLFSFRYFQRHPAIWSYVFGAVDSVKAGPNRSVVIRLKQPNAAMLDGIGRTRIIPRHIWEKVERPKEFLAPEALIGSGPYRLTSYSKEHGTYRFEAFNGFWGPKQRVRTIEYVPVSEPLLAYQKGELDLTGVTPDVMPRFKKDSANAIIQNPAFWGYRLLMGMDKAPCLRDVSVRRAIASAIDRQELVDKIARGAAISGSLGILPPNHVMAADAVRQYPFDLELASTLLDKAGYERMNQKGVRLLPDDAPFTLELLCSGREVRMAELIRQHFDEIGITLKIRTVDGKTRDARVRRSDYQLAIIGHGGWGSDPNYIAAHLFGDIFSQNSSPSHSGLPGLDAPELVALLQRQALEIDPVKRKSLVTKVQKMAADLVAEIPLFYTAGYSMYQPAKYDGWMYMYDHHSLQHGKLSYLRRDAIAAKRL